MTAWLNIIGVTEEGVAALSPNLHTLIASAGTVLGPARLIEPLTPLPTSPARGEVQSAANRNAMPHDEPSTLPGAGTSTRPARANRAGGSIGGEKAKRPMADWHGEGWRNTITGQKRMAWNSPLSAMLDQINSCRNTPTVILATGDPNWFGIGATLSRHFAVEEFVLHPAPSAFQLAAAHLHWPLQNVETITLHGRPATKLHPHLLPANRILALTSDRKTLVEVAKILAERGYGKSHLTTLENLGGPDERISYFPASEAATQSIGDFYVLAIDCIADPGAPLLPLMPGLPDDAFISDGQLTKRDVRAATLAKLAPTPGALLWDVGAGSGSVAIEWMRAARNAKAIAFEKTPTRGEMIDANKQALGTPDLKILIGDALENIANAEAPDAIFHGGDVSNQPLFDACWAALKPQGRLVANAVTLDGEKALFDRQKKYGGELTRLEISVLDTIGDERIFRPRMAVTQWVVTKEAKK